LHLMLRERISAKIFFAFFEQVTMGRNREYAGASNVFAWGWSSSPGPTPHSSVLPKSNKHPPHSLVQEHSVQHHRLLLLLAHLVSCSLFAPPHLSSLCPLAVGIWHTTATTSNRTQLSTPTWTRLQSSWSTFTSHTRRRAALR
jgi:hypothetical protein